MCQCWANVGTMLGQRWRATVGPTLGQLTNPHWPNVRVDVGPTLGQRRNASWDIMLDHAIIEFSCMCWEGPPITNHFLQISSSQVQSLWHICFILTLLVTKCLLKDSMCQGISIVMNCAKIVMIWGLLQCKFTKSSYAVSQSETRFENY